MSLLTAGQYLQHHLYDQHAFHLPFCAWQHARHCLPVYIYIMYYKELRKKLGKMTVYV